MASNKLKGITIEIGGDTADLQKAISAVDKKSRELRAELKEVNNALKFEPDNVELLAQKQDVLTEAVKATEDKLKTLLDAQKSVQDQWEKGEIGDEQFRAFQREIINTESKLNSYRKAIDNAKESSGDAAKSTETLTERVSRQQKELKELRQKYIDVTAEQGENSDEAKDLAKQIESLSGELSNNESRLSDAEKSADKYDRTLEDTEGSAKQTDDAVDDLSKSAKDSGDSFSTAAVAVGTFMGNLAADVLEKAVEAMGELVTNVAEVGISFESSFAGVKKTVNGTDEEIAQLRTDIIDMSKDMPASADEIAEIAEAAGQLGIETDVIASFTEVMANLGVSTNMSSTEAASSLAKFANVVQMSSDNYDKLGSTIVALGNNYATTEADIVSMATRLSSTGAVVGLSEPQIMAIATALSSVGIEAEAGGSAVSKLLKQMETSVQTYGTANGVIASTGHSLRELELMASLDGPAFKDLAGELGLTTAELKKYMESAKSLEQFADVAGMSADQFIAAWGDDAVDALSSFIGGLSDVDKAGGSAVAVLQEMGLTEVRLSNAVLSLASSDDILNKTLNTANSAWDENAALTNEAAQRYETLESQLQILNNNADALSITMYDKVRGSMGDVIKTANTELMPALEGMLNGVEGSEEQLSAALVTIATDVLDTVVGALPDVMSVVGSVLGALGQALTEVAPDVIDILGDLIVELVNSLTKGAPGMRKSATKLLSSLLSAFEEVVDSLLDALPDLIEEICEFLIDSIPLLVDSAITLFWGIVDAIPEIVIVLGEQLPMIITTIIDALETSVPILLAAAFNLLYEIVDAIELIIPPLIEALPEIISTIVGILADSIPLILDGAVTLLEAIVDAIPLIIPPLLDALPTIIDTVIDLLVDSIPLVIDAAVKLLNAVIDAIPLIIPPLIEALPEIIDSLISGLVGATVELQEASVTLLTAIVDAIPKFIPDLVKALPQICGTIVATLISNIPHLTEKAGELLGAIISAIPDMIVDLAAAIPDIIKAMVDGLAAGWQQVFDVGKDLMDGLIDGIESRSEALTDATKSVTKGILDILKGDFDIHSPSKRTHWMGRMLDEGLMKGIEEYADEPLDAIDKMAASMLDEMDGMNGITLERRLNATFGADDLHESEGLGILGRLDSILQAIERGQILLLDGDAVVGGTASRYDQNLGEKQILIERGAL